MMKNYKVIVIFLFITIFFSSPVFAQDTDERTRLLTEAQEPFSKGEYKNAIELFDKILETDPADYRILELKGIALSNLRLESTLAMQPHGNISPGSPSELNKLSMLEFYKVLEINPNSTVALNGMGLGFGNFGEYSEAERYFQKSLKINPDNTITQNYLTSLENIKEKYALDTFENPTKKPDYLQQFEGNTIPFWIRNNAGWWANDKIGDDDFISGIQYLVKNNIINISIQNSQENSSDVIPAWIKNNAGWWATGKISDDDFLAGIKYLIENNIIEANTQTASEQQQQSELDRKAWNFEKYLRDIQSDIKKQNRYVENINPSEYVIIKYWKNYDKWNLGQYLGNPNMFPDRTLSFDSDADEYRMLYKVYVNEQPTGLPIDHVNTLESSFNFWEKYEFKTNDGKIATVIFQPTSVQSEASIWVTWVVRNIGEGVLGHATLGKGVVEVAIGGYGCDGSFQLFDAETVEYVMTHELGHSIGLGHSDNPEWIMYPLVLDTSYAYCLLSK